MAAFEGSQKSQLQGVSQQIARERLDGQVTAQENMLSDVVTGLRRRPGCQVRTQIAIGVGRDNVLGWDTDVGGIRVKVLLNTVNGFLHVYDENWVLLQDVTPNPYLAGGARSDYQVATVGSEFFILNRQKHPALVGVAPGRAGDQGFLYVKTGQFSREYKVTISWNGAPVTTLAYTTPPNDGTVPDAAAKSTPEYIVAQLMGQAVGVVIGAQQAGAYGYLEKPGVTQFNVSSDMPTSLMGVSNQAYVLTPSDLPAKLGPAGQGMTIATGSLRQPTYFSYDVPTTAWLEVGKVGSPGGIVNMPGSLHQESGTWVFNASYEGRYAGDDTSNPAPAFIARGITGMGSFQNRLVLLAGNMVCMSASANPYRWFRSTVTNLIASDPIEVGAAGNSSAAYQYAVQFQKDLLLFSEKYQALVPGGNVLTPSNATVIITSTYEADMTAAPVTLGRTLVYPAPRSNDFFGMLEMVPSQYTDSQYLSEDVTAHLPKYLPGRCRFGLSSSVANIAVFASTNDYRTLIVHEYLWNGNDKVQQAWHKWTFPYDIADAFFAGSEINLLFSNGGQMLICTLDPRIGTLTAAGERRPYLDCYADGIVQAGNVLPLPPALTTFDTNAYTVLKVSDSAVDLMGEEVGVVTRLNPTTLITVPSFGVGAVTVGIPYRSSVSPTTPLIKDANGVVISSNKLTILRYMIGMSNSAEFEAIVSDASSEDADTGDQDMSTLYWGSNELDLGAARVSTESISILSCRTAASTTTLVMFTDGLGEMNLISLEYVCRYNQKLKRR